MKFIVLIHLASTLTMVGVILIIQIVHYPLFSNVAAESFIAYEARHTQLITLIVLPLMLCEAISSLILTAQPPPNIPTFPLWLGVIMLSIIWGMTMIIHVPQHGLLSQGFDSITHNTLVSSNWIRTIAWIMRGLIALWIIYEMMPAVNASK
ncbi:MAG: hypothetical protein RLP44_02710 [Aggregatilineales bacterium]